VWIQEGLLGGGDNVFIHFMGKLFVHSLIFYVVFPDDIAIGDILHADIGIELKLVQLISIATKESIKMYALSPLYYLLFSLNLCY
jgi:hypothetical protein